jgi:hypothetical protein
VTRVAASNTYAAKGLTGVLPLWQGLPIGAAPEGRETPSVGQDWKLSVPEASEKHLHLQEEIPWLSPSWHIAREAASASREMVSQLTNQSSALALVQPALPILGTV